MKKALLAVLTALLLLACATAVACAGAQNVALDPGSAPQTIYVLGSDLNLDKGALVVDGETVPLNADGVEITGYDKDKLGQQTLTVTYKGKSTQLIVNVVPAFQAAEKYVYFLGETLEDAHPRFIVTATDGTQTPVNIGDAGLTVTGFDSSKAAETLTLNASYQANGQNVTGTFDVSVCEPQVSFRKPTKHEYGNHETKLDMTGASLTLKDAAGSTTRNVSTDDIVTEGFNPSAVTADKPSATQTISVKYRGRTVDSFEVTIEYSNVSKFRAAAEQLAKLDWSCYERPTEENPGMREPAAATPELKELSVEMLQLYYTFTRNDLVYLKLSELESVARLAVVSSYNEWMDAVTVYADAFTIDEVGAVAYTCDTLEDAKKIFDKLKNESDPDTAKIFALSDLMNNSILLDNCKNSILYVGSKAENDYGELVDVELKISDLASVVRSSSFMRRISQVLEWSINAYNELVNVPSPSDWKTADLSSYGAHIEEAYKTVMEISNNEASDTSLFPLLNGWRTEQDYFEFLYRYFFADFSNEDSSTSSSSLSKIDSLVELMMPMPLEALRESYASGQVAQVLLQTYASAVQSGQVPLLFESTLFLYLYQEATDQAEKLLETEDAMYQFLYTVYYAPILSEMQSGDYGYLDLRSTSAYDEEVQGIWDQYFKLWNQYNDDPAAIEDDEFNLNVKAMFESFLELMPYQQLKFIRSLNYLYGMYPSEDAPQVALYPDENGLFTSDFTSFIYRYYFTQLGIDAENPEGSAYDIFTGLMLALESFANEDVNSFCNYMQEVISTYESWSDSDAKSTFDNYLKGFYTKYTGFFALFEQVQDGEETVWEYKETDLGEFKADFDSLYTATGNASLASLYIDDEYGLSGGSVGLYLPFFASYENVRAIAEKLETADENIRNAYYFMAYGDSTTTEPLYDGVYDATDAYTRYLLALGVEPTAYETAEELRAFLKEYQTYFWTVASAFIPMYQGEKFDYKNAEEFAGLLTQYLAVNTDEQFLMIGLDTLNLFYSGLESCSAEIFGADSAEAALFSSLLTLDITYIAYTQNPDGTIEAEDPATGEAADVPYAEYILNNWETAKAAYGELAADAKTKFDSYCLPLYNYLTEKCAELAA